MIEYFQEDGLVENLTVVAYVAAAVLGVIAWVRRCRPTWMAVLVTLAGTLGALDELSFGQRIFDTESFVVRGHEIDAVHDVFEAVYREIRALGTVAETIVWLVVVALVVVAVGAIYRRRDRVRRELSFAEAGLPKMLFIGAIAAAFLALVLDLEFWVSNEALAMEETLELGASVLVAASGGAMLVGRPSRAAEQRRESLEPADLP